MTTGRGWRWVGLGLIGVLAAVFAAFNSGERVALHLGFTVLYRVPLVTLIFVAFIAGMTTMLLLGLRHDLRVRRALQEAGFGDPVSTVEDPPRWEDDDAEETGSDPLPAGMYADAPNDTGETKRLGTPEFWETRREVDAEPEPEPQSLNRSDSAGFNDGDETSPDPSPPRSRRPETEPPPP